MSRPYVAKSLTGATATVRRLQKELADSAKLVKECHQDRVLLAKLSATGPAFSNPTNVALAELRRDYILSRYCNLNPDGTPK